MQVYWPSAECFWRVAIITIAELVGGSKVSDIFFDRFML